MQGMGEAVTTASEKRYMNCVAELGCIVEGCGAPAEIHHPRFAAGMAQKASNFLVIPLCPEHHRNGGHGVAIHAGQATFCAMYGEEEELLAMTIKRVFSE